MLSEPVSASCFHMCPVHRDGCRKLEEVFFRLCNWKRGGNFPHGLGWKHLSCIQNTQDIHTRTHTEVYCPNGTARAPLKYLSPAVLGCCVCQPNVCWYPSHYAECIICHVVGRCLVCGPMDNSQTLQMNVSHNTRAQSASPSFAGHPSPSLAAKLTHSPSHRLSSTLFLFHTHTCSFKADSLTLPIPFSLTHSYSLSQSLVC